MSYSKRYKREETTMRYDTDTKSVVVSGVGDADVVVPLSKARVFNHIVKYVLDDEDSDEGMFNVSGDDPSIVHQSLVEAFDMLNMDGTVNVVRVGVFIQRLAAVQDIRTRQLVFETVMEAFDKLEYDYLSSVFYLMMRPMTTDIIDVSQIRSFNSWRRTQSQFVRNKYGNENCVSVLQHAIVASVVSHGSGPTSENQFVDPLYPMPEAYRLPRINDACMNIFRGYGAILRLKMLNGSHHFRGNVVSHGEDTRLRMYTPEALSRTAPSLCVSRIRLNFYAGDSLTHQHRMLDELGRASLTDIDYSRVNTHNIYRRPDYVQNTVSSERDPGLYFVPNMLPSKAEGTTDETKHVFYYYMYALPIQVTSLMSVYINKTRASPVQFQGVVDRHRDTFQSMYEGKIKGYNLPWIRSTLNECKGKWCMLQLTLHGPMLVVYRPTEYQRKLPSVLPAETGSHNLESRLPQTHEEMCGETPTVQEVLARINDPEHPVGGYGLSEQHDNALYELETLLTRTATNWSITYLAGTQFSKHEVDWWLTMTDRMFFPPWGGMYMAHNSKLTYDRYREFEFDSVLSS